MTLRLIYRNQHQLTFKELLEKNKAVSIHQGNLQTLATEICIAKSKISPEIVKLLFEFTNKNYNLRNASVLERKGYFTVHYGSECLSSENVHGNVSSENMGTCSRFNQTGENIYFQK